MDNIAADQSLRIAGLGIGAFVIILGFFVCILAFLVTPLVKTPGKLMFSVTFCYLSIILYLLNAPKTTRDEVSEFVCIPFFEERLIDSIVHLSFFVYCRNHL